MNIASRRLWSDARVWHGKAGRFTAHRGKKRGNRFFAIYRRCAVFLDGQDVSADCFFFDRRSGTVGMYESPRRIPEGADYCAEIWRKGKVSVYWKYETEFPLPRPRGRLVQPCA